MTDIFVSYRRSDEIVGRIYDRLVERYGRDAVFLDVSTLAYGVSVPGRIAAAIARCEVFLVAIGPNWTDRLANLQDFVRLEVEQALKSNKRIVPILLNDASMPKAADLPAAIAEISDINAARVRGGADFKSDFERLAAAIEEVTTLRPMQPVATVKRIAPAAVSLAALAAGSGLLYLMLSKAQALAEYGLAGNLWFVLLVLLGVAAAVALCGAVDALASWEGSVLAGRVKLGGAPAIFFLVVVLGHVLIPSPPERFAFTVFVHGPAGPQALLTSQTARVSLHLQDDVRTEAVGAKGEARFMSLPAGLKGKEVLIGLNDPDHELAMPERLIKLSGDSAYVGVRFKELYVAGTVFSEGMKPVPGAVLSAGGQSTQTDAGGHFKVAFRVPGGTRVPVTAGAQGYKTFTTEATPSANSNIELLLDPEPK